MTDKDRRTMWKALAMSPVFSGCLQDVLLFACSELDKEQVRCGRQDVILYMQDSVYGTPEETDNG